MLAKYQVGDVEGIWPLKFQLKVCAGNDTAVDSLKKIVVSVQDASHVTDNWKGDAHPLGRAWHHNVTGCMIHWWCCVLQKAPWQRRAFGNSIRSNCDDTQTEHIESRRPPITLAKMLFNLRQRHMSFGNDTPCRPKRGRQLDVKLVA